VWYQLCDKLLIGGCIPANPIPIVVQNRRIGQADLNDGTESSNECGQTGFVKAAPESIAKLLCQLIEPWIECLPILLQVPHRGEACSNDDGLLL
jgi:hypothetical protein